MLAVLINKGRYLTKFIQLGLAKTLTALLLNFHQATICQYFKLKGYSLPADIKFFGNSIYIMRLAGNHIDDRSSGRVGYGLVNISSGYHIMQVSACKYKRKYLLAQILFKYKKSRGISGFPCPEIAKKAAIILRNRLSCNVQGRLLIFNIVEPLVTSIY